MQPSATKLAILVLLATSACSRSKAKADATPSTPSITFTAPPASSATRNEFTVSSTGVPFGLQVDAGTVSFCDKRGGRKLDLAAGRDIPFERTCPKDSDGNSGCDRMGLDVSVRTPGLGPIDIVDVDGKSFPLDGLIHDCAVDGDVLAIVTGSSVVIIDHVKGTTTLLDHDGGDRVAIGSKWVAWTSGSIVRAQQRK